MTDFTQLLIGGRWSEPSSDRRIEVRSPAAPRVAGSVPALLAGCTVILKPAPETPIDALMLGDVLVQAGLPEGVVSVLPADRAVSEYLVTHPGVDKVSFTGSTAAGRRVGALATERLKRVSLEVGGKSAALVLDHVDLGAAGFMLAYSGLMASGRGGVAQTA